MSPNRSLSRSRKWDPILIAALHGSPLALGSLFEQAHDGAGSCGLVPKLIRPIATKLAVPAGQQLQFVEDVSQEVAVQVCTPGRVVFDPKRASAVTLLRVIAWRCAVSRRQELKVVGRRRSVAADSIAAQANGKVKCLSLFDDDSDVLERAVADPIRSLETRHDASVVRENAPQLVASFYDAHYDRGLTQREAARDLGCARSTLMRNVSSYEAEVRRTHAA